MYYEWIQTHKKTIIISSLIIFVLLLLWGTTTYVTRVGKVGVTISAVPRDASVTIDNKEIGNGTHWVEAGTYTITASKDGFKERTKKVVVSQEKKQNAVALSLTPESDEALKWFETHSNDYKTNEVYGAIEARSNGEYFQLKNPVTRVLPYSDPYYTIAYEANGNNVTIVISTPSPRYRYFAVEKFRQLGFNPTDFRIEFKDFKTPLVEDSGDNENEK